MMQEETKQMIVWASCIALCVSIVSICCSAYQVASVVYK